VAKQQIEAPMVTHEFRMPLESDAHARTFMQWPSSTQIYGGRRALDAVQTTIALIASAIARFEPVVMLAGPEHTTTARARLARDITLWPIPTDDLWCRDSGPTFVVSNRGALAITDFGFNGWGNKQHHADDQRIAQRVAARLGIPVLTHRIIGEGGGVEVDGAGTAMAHESSWINPNRNLAQKTDVERALLQALGADHMIWAPGLKGADITDYHIDALARFVKPGQVVIQLGSAPDTTDPWSMAAFETYARLKNARDATGRKLDIVVLQEPSKPRSRARDFVSSYVNYYVCNGAVISAEFGDDTSDERASTLLAQLYPGRVVVCLNIDPIAAVGGGIHCATQQQPVATCMKAPDAEAPGA
jgi:agmatine deiminase